MILTAKLGAAFRPAPAAERRTIARTLALLFGSGGALLLLTLLLPPAAPGQRDETALALLAAIALVVAAGLLVRYERTPMWLLTLAPAVGSILIGAVICFAGPAAATSYALFFTWVVIAAATFLGRGATALHGVFAVLVYDAAVRITGPTSIPDALSLTMLAGTALIAAVILADLTARVRTFVAELESDARTDPLTGLDNRRALREAFERELARSDRTGRPLALIAFDLDHFKAFNDAYGHPAGDDALRRLSRIAEELTRSIEFTARTGGEEFAILAPDTDAPGAVALAERMRIAIENEFSDSRPALTVSFGIAIRHPDGLDARALVEAADRALYAAKDGGRNRVEIARRPSVRRFEVPGELDEPVEGDWVGERVA